MTRAKYWNLLRELTVSQIKLKDQSTFFGLAWSFLNPLLLVAVLYIFFQARLGSEIEHYALYLLIGVMHYTHFSTGTSAAMHVLLSMRQLTAQVIFPKELLVLGSVVANSFEFVLEMLLVVILAALGGIPLTGELLWLVPVMVLQFVLVLWVSLVLACLNVFVRDLTHLYNVFLRLLFFITPIFYAPDFLGSTPARLVLYLNPLAQLMTMSRSIILDGIPPSPGGILLFFGLNGAALFTAWRLFKRLEPRFAERL
jgi:lipopolysaccharide transport system permease protein